MFQKNPAFETRFSATSVDISNSTYYISIRLTYAPPARFGTDPRYDRVVYQGTSSRLTDPMEAIAAWSEAHRIGKILSEGIGQPVGKFDAFESLFGGTYDENGSMKLVEVA